MTAQSLVAEHPVQQNERWKFDLAGVNASILEADIVSVFSSSDKPCLITLGDPSYDMDMDMDSTLIKSMLYEKGELERWSVFGGTASRRIRAQATFVEESHAQLAASSLDGAELP